MILIINVSWVLNQHIRLIYEGSCDAEYWSNGCWKFSFAITEINYILKYIKTENSYFYCISDQINATLKSTRDLKTDPKLYIQYIYINTNILMLKKMSFLLVLLSDFLFYTITSPSQPSQRCCLFYRSIWISSVLFLLLVHTDPIGTGDWDQHRPV